MTLKYIFCFGVDEPLRLNLLGGTICWSLEQYIEFVLLLAGSPLTVGIVDEGLCNCSVPATPKPDHIMLAKPIC